MRSNKKNIQNFLELLGNLHQTADEYERLGLKPIDLIKSTDASKEIEAFEAIEPDKYDFESMSWGEACNFIISFSDYYHGELKKLRAVMQTKPLH